MKSINHNQGVKIVSMVLRFLLSLVSMFQHKQQPTDSEPEPSTNDGEDAS